MVPYLTYRDLSPPVIKISCKEAGQGFPQEYQRPCQSYSSALHNRRSMVCYIVIRDQVPVTVHFSCYFHFSSVPNELKKTLLRFIFSLPINRQSVASNRKTRLCSSLVQVLWQQMSHGFHKTNRVNASAVVHLS